MDNSLINCDICAERGDHTAAALCQGRIAVPGCVEGVVRVIHRPQEADLLVNGEVLVTPMTDPDSVPAMKRAVAVVTDRGGMLCHAAIVSREINKPCIVGARNATDVLRDGMRVRVCATRGVILAAE